MSVTLSDEQVSEILRAVGAIETSVGGSAAQPTTAAPRPLTWLQSLLNRATAWLSDPNNVVTTDQTGSKVITNFAAAFPDVKLAPQVVPVPPGAPGQPPTG